MTLFHIGGSDVKLPDDGVDFFEVLFGFFRRGKIRLGNDLNQGDAGTVKVDERNFFTTDGCMLQLAGIFFEVDPENTDFFTRVEGKVTIVTERLIILADLIALGQIGIKILFAVKVVIFIDFTVEGETNLDSIFDRLLIWNRQGAGKTETNRTGLTVRALAKMVGRTSAKHLGFGGQFDVDLETDDGGDFIFHGGFSRNDRRD